MNKRGQYNSFMDTYGVYLAIGGVVLVVLAVLISIQMITCSSGFPGNCLKVFCFGKIGMC
jgi:hypothetical protein